jgi:hypothetical protein
VDLGSWRQHSKFQNFQMLDDILNIQKFKIVRTPPGRHILIFQNYSKFEDFQNYATFQNFKILPIRNGAG